jgi:hypothetical protein
MKIEYSTITKAIPEQVWSVFSDLDGWSKWSSFFKESKWVSGTQWAPGSEAFLELAQPSFKLKLKTAEAVAPNRASYKAEVMGIAIQQWFEFVAQPAGGTLMKTWIEFNGPMVFLINEDMKKKGTAIFAQWFEAMKAQAESAAA